MTRSQRKGRIEHSHVRIKDVIADGFAKAMAHVKAHGFVAQMRMT